MLGRPVDNGHWLVLIWLTVTSWNNKRLWWGQLYLAKPVSLCWVSYSGPLYREETAPGEGSCRKFLISVPGQAHSSSETWWPPDTRWRDGAKELRKGLHLSDGGTPYPRSLCCSICASHSRATTTEGKAKENGIIPHRLYPALLCSRFLCIFFLQVSEIVLAHHSGCKQTPPTISWVWVLCRCQRDFKRRCAI
jgi:hypothetical protein